MKLEMYDDFVRDAVSFEVSIGRGDVEGIPAAVRDALCESAFGTLDEDSSFDEEWAAVQKFVNAIREAQKGGSK